MNVVSLYHQKEAEALIELLKEFPEAKAWLSMSCKVIMGNVSYFPGVGLSSEEGSFH